MADKNVTVLARIKAKEGMEERLMQESMSLIAPTRSELGCISYNLHQADDDRAIFIFYENWVSKKDLEKHLEMPYMKTWFEKTNELATGAPEITMLEMIA